MATIQTNSTWQNKPSVIKGNFAENIVRDYLHARGFIIYEPISDNAHGFDKLAVRDKKEFVIVECKAKAKRTKYDDTGINERHYAEYALVAEKYKMPVFIFFVDESLAEIYGNFLSVLEKKYVYNGEEYPKRYDGIIYFPMCAMRRGIAFLSPEQIEFLKIHSKRNYEYANAINPQRARAGRGVPG